MTLDPGIVTAKKSPEAAGQEAVRQKLILIVEDSEDIRWMLVELLEGEGYSTAVATNGQDGLDSAQRLQPALILMDLSLPGMDGWETVRHLRRLPAFKSTPIIALTAHATEQDKQRALAAGCSAYISKPFDMETLLEKLDLFFPSLRKPTGTA